MRATRGAMSALLAAKHPSTRHPMGALMHAHRHFCEVDALDLEILRHLGVKPFVGRPRRTEGLKPSAVARALGRNPQLVKDRIARMESQGIIAAYRLFPNVRHCGLALASFHLLGHTIARRHDLARLSDVDGLVGVLWFYGGDVCVDISYAGSAELARRLQLVAHVAGAESGPLPLYDRPLPEVARPLSALDWRIIRALWQNARRPLPEVAREVGVTVKTVRARLQAMRREGSVDEHVELNYERISGLIPFNLAAWLRPGAEGARSEVLKLFHDRYLIHFPPPREQGPPTLMLQLFARAPAEIEALLQQASEVEGVVKVASLMPTGGYYTDRWLAELVDTHAGVEPRRFPKPAPAAPKREILS